jgi:hypothetical protein
MSLKQAILPIMSCIKRKKAFGHSSFFSSFSFPTSMAEPTQDESSTIHSDQVQVIEKPKAFDPQDVGISLTKPQLILTFIGYVHGFLIDIHVGNLLITLYSIAICLFLAALDT